MKLLSPADRYVYEYDWIPDGSGFVVTSALGNGDNNWWIAELDRIDAGTGAVRRIAAPRTQLNQPRVSPDGRTVAFIGGLMSDFGSIGGDVYTVPILGGEPVDRTPPIAAVHLAPLGPRWPDWLGADWRSFGNRALTSTGPAQPTWSAPVSIAAGGAKIARSDKGHSRRICEPGFRTCPGNLCRSAPNAPRQITHDNDNWAPLVTAQSLTWRSGAFNVQGWLLAPRAPLGGRLQW